jgi:hypothetical protein
MPYSAHFILFLSCVCFISACKKDSDEINLHQNYFPIEEGRFMEYDVISVFHDDLSGIHDTTNYVLKVVIGDTLIDNHGRIAHKYFRYIYDDFYQEFKIKDLWSTILDQGRAELIEENQRIIKLVFSPSADKEWDMNAFNYANQRKVKYDNIHKSYNLPNFNFDSTLTVVEENSAPSLIHYAKKHEIYAKNVGLIKKYYKDIEINNFDTLQVVSGTELYYTLRNFGKE